ncbi:MAG: type II toxin-antitoxin system HicA family toxin [Planctomycetota bacterium]|nr:MAG: type II toxin-antitoxin system HicA family toxin [Planctomycetota bacterium]
MSDSLPVISGQRAVRAFQRAGFRVVPRRGKGSHIVLVRDEPWSMLTIPDHKELKRGLVRALIRQSGLSVAEFVKLL